VNNLDLVLYKKACQLRDFLENHEEHPKKAVGECIELMNQVFSRLDRRGR